MLLEFCLTFGSHVPFMVLSKLTKRELQGNGYWLADVELYHNETDGVMMQGESGREEK